MSTGLIIFFVLAGVLGVAIAFVFSVDSISGNLFGASDRDKEIKK